MKNLNSETKSAQDRAISAGFIPHDAVNIKVAIVDIPKPKKPSDANRKIQLLEKHPERVQQWRESLKQFDLIKRNIYVERKKKKQTEDDIFICECYPIEDPAEAAMRERMDRGISINCGSRCLNKLMSTECDPTMCRCGELCQNRRFQNHQDSFVYPFLTNGKGWGLCAGEKIKAGQFIMQYIGEIFSLNSEEGQFRMNLYSKSACTYLMQISAANNEVVDPTFKGNHARFINHSCDPNCVTQKWNVLGEVCVGIFAIRDIEEDEELTFDYQFESYKTALTKCLCGAKTCKMYLGYIPAQFSADDWEERLEVMPCGICGNSRGQGGEEDDLILCDNCNNGFHTYCLTPPLKEIPKDAWFCPKCREKIDNNNDRIQDSITRVKESMEAHRKALARRRRGREDWEGYNSPEEEEPRQRNKYYKDYGEFYEYQKALLLNDPANKTQMNSPSQITIVDEKDENQPAASSLPGQQKEDMIIVEKGFSDSNKMKDETDSGRVTQRNEYLKIRPALMEKFLERVKTNETISKKLAEFETRGAGGNEMNKKVIMINSIQLDVIRGNQTLFGKIGAKIFWDHASIVNDLSIKCRELNLLASAEQIDFVQRLLGIIEDLCYDYRSVLGQVDAVFKIPALYLKRLIGYQHATVHNLERKYCISIQYDKRHSTDECFSMEFQTSLRMKGMKENIIKCCGEIKIMMKSLIVRRIFYTRNEIKTILANLDSIKREIRPAEFKINRDPIIKELNHPFYYLTYKEREVAIVGTEAEANATETLLKDLIEKDRVKHGPPFVTVPFLWPSGFRTTLSRIKKELENEFPKCKMIFHDAAAPRKNITISLTSPPSVRKDLKEAFKVKMAAVNVLDPVQDFQDYVNYQMTKYQFKYLQNFIHFSNTTVMKGWDLVSYEFQSVALTSYLDSIKNYVVKDQELQLYMYFINHLTREAIYNNYGFDAHDLIQLMKFLVCRTLNAEPELRNNRYYHSIFHRDRGVKEFLQEFDLRSFLTSEIKKSDLDNKIGQKISANINNPYLLSNDNLLRFNTFGAPKEEHNQRAMYPEDPQPQQQGPAGPKTAHVMAGAMTSIRPFGSGSMIDSTRNYEKPLRDDSRSHHRSRHHGHKRRKDGKKRGSSSSSSSRSRSRSRRKRSRSTGRGGDGSMTPSKNRSSSRSNSSRYSKPHKKRHHHNSSPHRHKHHKRRSRERSSKYDSHGVRRHHSRSRSRSPFASRRSKSRSNSKGRGFYYRNGGKSRDERRNSPGGKRSAKKSPMTVGTFQTSLPNQSLNLSALVGDNLMTTMPLMMKKPKPTMEEEGEIMDF